MPLQEQDILQGRYRVVRSIKSGGMGAVYEAIDNKLAGTPCAIKEVLPSALQGPDAQYVLQSFDSEVKALANLEHPNIPRVRDYFEQEGSRFIVLDLVKGKSLDEELREHLKITQTPMDPAIVALDMVSVLETLHYLHTRRPCIVHRDVKPANLIRDDSGRVKLVDFGIARALESLQRPQTQVGTPGYCAPEQMSGRAEPRSDVYSVGATLYHLCSGKAPPAFCFDELELDLPDHPGLAPIVSKATAMKPDRRFASAEEMAEALRAWLRGENTTHELTNPKQAPAQPTLTKAELPTAAPSIPQNSQDNILYAAIAILIALLGGFFVWVARQNSEAAARPPQPGLSASPLSVSSPSPGPTHPQTVHPSPKPTVAMRPRVPQPKPSEPRKSPGPGLPPRGQRPVPAPSSKVEKKPLLVDSSYPTYPRGPRSSTPSSTKGQTPKPTPPTEPIQETPPSPQVNPSPANSEIAGFRWQRPTFNQDGGGEYVSNQGMYEVKIITHPFPGLSNEEILQHSANFIPAGARRFPRKQGICILTESRSMHQAFHVEKEVMYDIQIRPRPLRPEDFTGKIDQFFDAYRKRALPR